MLMKPDNPSPVTGRGGGRARPVRLGFTLVEVLVVVAVIVILVTLLIVALAAATTRAGTARTSALMQAMAQATSRFKEDHGVLPQMLNLGRDYLPPPAPGDFNALQDWWTMTGPAEYFIGYGDSTQDGADGVGIRNPSRDGVWGASRFTGLLSERTPIQSGKVYEPYLQLEDEDLLGSIDAAGNVFLPSDGGFDPADPKVILDYWGRPIRMYIDHPNRGMDLGDVIALRPFRMTPGSEGVSPHADAGNDAYTSQSLKSAGFAFFSMGPDGEWNPLLRYDDPDDPDNSAGTDFANEDNLVEVGQ